MKHVFLIVLADQAYAQTFGPESPAPYIAHTLEHQGELLVRFYGVAHEELADEVALISGLGPTPQTAADCPTFSDIVPGQANSKGQYTGDGCIYPKEAQTVGEQLTAKGLTWKVYAEGLGDVPGVESQAGASRYGAGASISGAGGASGAGTPPRRSPAGTPNSAPPTRPRRPRRVTRSPPSATPSPTSTACCTRPNAPTTTSASKGWRAI